MRYPTETFPLLASIELAAAQSIQELSRLSGMRSHKARYLISNLTSSKIIRRMSLLDLSRVGLRPFLLLGTALPLRTDEVFSKLAAWTRSQSFCRLVRCLGSSSFVLTFHVASVDEAVDFVDKVAHLLAGALKFKTLLIPTESSFYRRRYLGQGTSVPFYTCSYSLKPNENFAGLDDIDKRIIISLFNGAEDRPQSLARQLSCGSSMLTYRLQRLRDYGVLLGARYELQPERVGRSHFLTLFRFAGSPAATYQELRRWSDAEPSVITCSRSVGDWDAMLAMECPSIDQYQSSLDRMPSHLRIALSDAESLSLVPEGI